jgi:hypothetical protein
MVKDFEGRARKAAAKMENDLPPPRSTWEAIAWVKTALVESFPSINA